MMKKVYRKPEIMFEHLELDNAISACTYILARDCRDVTPADGEQDIPFDRVNTIDGGVTRVIYETFYGNGCDSSHECYHIPTLTNMTHQNLS